MELEILYRDDYIVAVNKPSGLLVHKSPIDRNETTFALQLVRDQIGQYVYPVHRLDKPTSGVLLFALDEKSAQIFSAMFRNGQVKKSYAAVVRGYLHGGGVIDPPLKQMLDTKEQKRKGVTKEPQEARTFYEGIATVELPIPVSRYQVARYSLVKLSPQTGRKHQLRRHMKHIFHPIIGDTKHGRGEHNRLFRTYFGTDRLLLHAKTMVFIHPVTLESCRIEADFDEKFNNLFAKFDWNWIE